MVFNGKQRSYLAFKIGAPTYNYTQTTKILIEEWRKEYNQVRPHSSLDYRPPAPEAIIPVILT